MTGLHMGTWAVPGDGRDQWGIGVSIRPADGTGPTMYFRFYEWNLFGAVREGLHTQADQNQRLTATIADESIVIGYPDHRIELEATPGDGGVDLAVTATNTTDRDWPPLASIVPCFSPGMTTDREPVTPRFADPEHEHTYFLGRSGFEPLVGRDVHWLADVRDRVERDRPASGYPWEHKWPMADRDAAEPLLVREGSEGEWATGIAWERSLSVQGHNPWRCLHLSARLGPVSSGETASVRGKLYLQRGDKETIRGRYESDFRE